MTHVFDDTRELARRLADAGFEGHAEQLLAAMSQGATGTEILMILRSRLSNVIDDELSLLSIKAALKDCAKS
ncbi:hypothetical protein [Paraburkholderia phenazinium]|uniref:Uncharacterized protein n=1 Tax=Paraburkholderia phenazinium TaxID=60549 RepID=A0A1G8MDF1_9BURK|nr:hypothetical protein [Paraburkholderia phenazinium]SDI65897.1 hypothetical protein SAMN05216466_12936 [Paraburkholderia phenazinium]